MAGRRVAPKNRKHNPLYSLFMLLLLLVIALAVITAVLGIKLRAANKQLAQYQNTSIEQTVEEPEQQEQAEREDPVIDKGVITRNDTERTEAETAEKPTAEVSPAATEKKTVGWLDLTGHSEVEVIPSVVLDSYQTCYASDGVNLRSGPGTNYSKVKTLDLGTELKAAAKEGEWTFVSVGGKFGWIKSEYISKTRPEVKSESESTTGEIETPVQTPEAETNAAESQETPEWLRTE